MENSGLQNPFADAQALLVPVVILDVNFFLVVTLLTLDFLFQFFFSNRSEVFTAYIIGFYADFRIFCDMNFCKCLDKS